MFGFMYLVSTLTVIHKTMVWNLFWYRIFFFILVCFHEKVICFSNITSLKIPTGGNAKKTKGNFADNNGIIQENSDRNSVGKAYGAPVEYAFRKLFNPIWKMREYRKAYPFSSQSELTGLFDNNGADTEIVRFWGRCRACKNSYRNRKEGGTSCQTDGSARWPILWLERPSKAQ